MMEFLSVYGSVKLFLQGVWALGLVKTIVYSLAFTIILWIGYGMMMSLQRARDNNVLTNPAKCIAYPLLFVFVIMDFVFNFIICTVLFLEWPQIIKWEGWKPKLNNEWLATQRISRYMYHTEWPKKPESSNQWFKLIMLTYFLNGWRILAAVWLARNFLDPLEPNGQHCKP